MESDIVFLFDQSEVLMTQHDFTLFCDKNDSTKFFIEHVAHFDSGSVSGSLIVRADGTLFNSKQEAVEAMQRIYRYEIDGEDGDFPFTVVEDEDGWVIGNGTQFVDEYRAGFWKLTLGSCQ